MERLYVDEAQPEVDPFPIEGRGDYRVSVIARPGDTDPAIRANSRAIHIGMDVYVQRPGDISLGSSEPSSAREYYESHTEDGDVLVFDGVYSGSTMEFLGYHAGALTVFKESNL